MNSSGFSNRQAPTTSVVDKFIDDGDAGGGPVDISYPQHALSISAIRAFLWRQRLVVGAAIVLALLVSLVLTLLATPMYEAHSTVRVEPYYNQIVEGQDYTEPYIPTPEISQYMETLTEVVGSRQTALRVVDMLNLVNDPTMAGDDVIPADDEAALNARRMAIAEGLRQSLSVEAPYTNRVMTISYVSPDPIQAARIANAYAQAFLQNEVERGVDANSYARQYLEDQIDEVRDLLREAELEANAYARSNRIINQSSADPDQPSSTLTASTLASLNEAYTEARERRIEAEQRWRAAQPTPALNLPSVAANSSVIALRNERAAVEARLTELLQRYQEDYPEVREARAQLEQIDRQINSIAGQLKQSIRDEYEVAQRQEIALQAEREQASQLALDEQDRRVQFGLIERSVQSYRTQLAELLDRYNSVSTAANIRTSQATLLDEAAVPRAPYSPNLLRNLLIALVLGAALGGSLAFLRELMDDRLRSIDELERRLGLPGLGQTPMVMGEVDDYTDDPFSPISEAYASIRTTLEYTGKGGKCKTLQITSSQAGEGKSTSSLALASRFGQVGRKTLLVDADFRRPRLLTATGVNPLEVDFVDVLFHRAPLRDAIIQTSDNVYMLPLLKPTRNSIQILSSGLIPEFLESVRGEFDVIIFDSSPVMGIADAPLLARFMDGVVMVVEANRAKFSQVRSSVRRLRDVNANILGAIVTKYRALDAGQDLSYQYAYYSYHSSNED